MKKVTFIILLMISSVFAQSNSVTPVDTKYNAFVAPSVKYSSIKNDDGILVGGSCGYHLNDQLLVGVEGYGLVNDVLSGVDAQRAYYYHTQPKINLGYGGAHAEYFFNPGDLVNSSVSLLIGGGSVSYSGVHHMNATVPDEKNNAFFVLEPGFNGEVNVASFLKVGLNVSYRFVTGVDLAGLSNADLSNFSGGLSLKIGVF